jgi:hypothetical protein
MDIRSVSLRGVNLSSILFYLASLNFNSTTNFSSLNTVTGWSFQNSSQTYSLDGSTRYGINTMGRFANPTYSGGWIPLGSATATIGQTDPSGGTNATLVTLPAATQGTNQWATLSSLSGNTSTSFTYSVYLRTTTGTATVALRWEDYGSTYAYSSDITVTTSWQRFTLTFTPTRSTTVINVGITNGSAGGAATVLIAQAQLETGSVATPYANSTAGNTSAPRISSSGMYVEGSATNLIYPSQSGFAAFTSPGWSYFNCATGADNNATAPDGTTTASALTDNGSNTYHSDGYSGVSLAAGTYTYSQYLKGGTGAGRYGFLTFGNSGSYIAVFDLTGAGAVTATNGTGTSGITSVGNGWYRCWISASLTAASYQIVWGFAGSASPASLTPGRGPSYTGSGDTLIGWGAQVESGSTPTSYIPTTTATVTRSADTASLTYSGTATSAVINTSGIGTLTYPSAGVTNTLTYSQDFTNSIWYAVGATNTTLQTAPDGTNTAALITETGSSLHVFKNTSVTYPSTTVTASVFIKSVSRRFIALAINNTLQNAYAILDTNTGSITSTGGSGSPTILSTIATSVGNGWWRLSLSVTITQTSGTVELYSSQTGTDGFEPSFAGTSSYYVWGLQVENGANVNGYVPTTTAARTFTPTSPLNLTQSPFLNQYIQSVTINSNASTTALSLNFQTSTYYGALSSTTTYTVNGTTYGSLSSVPGWSLSNSTGGYSLDGAVGFFSRNYVQNSSSPTFGLTGATTTANATTAPDGTTTATRINGDGTTNFHNAGVSAITTPSATVVTASVYVKQGTTPYFTLTLRDSNNAAQAAVSFDLTSTNSPVITTTTGASNPSFSLISATGGWYRASLTVTFATAITFPSITVGLCGTFNNGYYAGSDNGYVWGWQLEPGTQTNAYVATTGTIASGGAPRITSAGLLIENAGINYFGNFYQPTGTAVAGPSGVANAIQLTSNGYYQFGSRAIIPTGATYTISYYIKSFGLQYIQCPFNPGDVAGSVYANFDIINGLVTATYGVTATITPAANGYFRVAVTYAFTGPTTGQQVYFWTIATGTTGFAGAGPATAQSFAFWGIQIEAGTSTSSYIPSASSTITTRDADVTSLTYTGNPSSITVNYTGGSASVSLISPINLGASSGGAWVGQNITSVVVQ